MTAALAGIFIGGAASRMGGIAKGLLTTAEGTTVVERTRRILVGLGLRVVLVGERKGYERVEMEWIADEVAGIGPLGGLLALLERVKGGTALAVACDMPYLSAGLLERLIVESPGATALAPRHAGKWEPLCARYDSARVMAPARALARQTRRSLQRLLDEVGAEELELREGEGQQLRDWDRPEDLKG